MSIKKILYRFLLFAFLTVITQIGGIVFLVTLLFGHSIATLTQRPYLRRLAKFSVFLVLYGVATFFLVPPIAKQFGRVPLPIFRKHNLGPLTVFTCLLNRHYVQPELKTAVMDVADKMNMLSPGSKVNYLDAGFPFCDGFPLLPHLSHNNGKKLDLAFCYVNLKGKPLDDAATFWGYGATEMPKAGETDMPGECADRGYWQYSFLKSLAVRKHGFLLDEKRTAALINLFAKEPPVEKVFLEPHLKQRMKLTSYKIRYHGCQAVRHDDHFHVQLN
ncbi:hypothetical protein [Foetidibacter luteolus]|uniref:hypothetical protein n=1 Tax=Foetidibacter luteolus TaxID=2608880 RepID=UPI00129B8E81|nr:hypothetical protein [Foetidibacter luteolus]